VSAPPDVLAAALHELERLPGTLHAMVGGLDEAVARQRPAPAEWSPVEIVCHLRDEETDDFGARVRAVLGGASRFAPIDPERWVEERRYRDARIGEVVRELGARRQASLAFLAGIDAERLGGAVVLSGGGRLSGLDLLVAWVAHDRLHTAQLAAALARLWAERWRPLRADYAGPIPYGEDAA
jgi:hypothetical protein